MADSNVTPHDTGHPDIIPDDVTDAYIRELMIAYVKRDKYAMSFLKNKTKVDINEVINFHQVSTAAAPTVTLIRIGKTIVKGSLKMAKGKFIKQFPVLDYLKPENIDTQVSESEYMAILNSSKNKSKKPANLWVTVGMNMLMQLFSDSIGALATSVEESKKESEFEIDYSSLTPQQPISDSRPPSADPPSTVAFEPKQPNEITLAQVENTYTPPSEETLRDLLKTKKWEDLPVVDPYSLLKIKNAADEAVTSEEDYSREHERKPSDEESSSSSISAFSDLEDEIEKGVPDRDIDRGSIVDTGTKNVIPEIQFGKKRKRRYKPDMVGVTKKIKQIDNTPDDIS